MSLIADLEPLLNESSLHVRLSHLSENTFAEFCRHNPDLRVEQDAEGTLIIMSPTVSSTGIYSGRLFGQLDAYCEQTENGYAFDSSSGFTLPNRARRSPDASWIPSDRWENLTTAEQDSFAPICPDLIIELMSASDSLADSQAKMTEYRENGSRMGLLIDRKWRVVFVYRPGEQTVSLSNPREVSCDPVVPGFALKLSRIF